MRKVEKSVLQKRLWDGFRLFGPLTRHPGSARQRLQSPILADRANKLKPPKTGSAGFLAIYGLSHESKGGFRTTIFNISLVDRLASKHIESCRLKSESCNTWSITLDNKGDINGNDV